ncbi:MAG: flagellar basal-body rod protein FlgF [Deltaproteobacteria bacterium]|nr:flagellar basal-body rod protein FlgF [Deltaproteobacteria bacterium]
MSDGIYAALSGAIGQARSLDVVANNVANVNTVGFRADRVAFREALSQAGTDGPAPDALRFSQISQIATSDAPGALEQTGGSLDLALSGDGFFVVRGAQGDRYTRAGNFVTDADGVLRTREGLAVMGRPEDPSQPEPVEIRIPRSTREISIGVDGTVRADGTSVGQLRLVNLTEAQKEGRTLFTAQRAEDTADTEVQQGYLEGSNINAVAGLIEMITVTRSFEAFQKVIDTFRQLDNRSARDLAGRG